MRRERERERALDAHVHTHAMPPPAMNGAGNLAPGSRGAVSPSGQVNSWRERSTERLLHSRQCELPFQISIFYAYTCRTCGQPDTNNRPRGSFRGLILYAGIPFYTDTYDPSLLPSLPRFPRPACYLLLFYFPPPFRSFGQMVKFLVQRSSLTIFKGESVEFRARNFSFPF